MDQRDTVPAVAQRDTVPAALADQHDVVLRTGKSISSSVQHSMMLRTGYAVPLVLVYILHDAC